MPVDGQCQSTIAVMSDCDLLIFNQPFCSATTLPGGKGETVCPGGGCADVRGAVGSKVGPCNLISGIDIHPQSNGRCVRDYVLGNNFYIDI